MGCSAEKPQTGNVLDQYVAAGFVIPDSSEYENDFEKKLFMAINLFRHEPKRFIPMVKKVYKEHVLLKGSKTCPELVQKLQSLETLTQVRFDGSANDACRQNNADIVEKNEAVPAKGGNIEKYRSITGEEKAGQC